MRISELVSLKMKALESLSDESEINLLIVEGKGKKEIIFENPEIVENNAIKDELQSFAKAIISNSQPLVTVEDGYNALRIASIIYEKMKFTADNFSLNK